MNRVFLLLIFFSTFLSCTKQETTTISGSLIGFVNLKDSGNVERINKQGTKVVLEGQGKNLTSITNSYGKYSFNDIPTGTYKLSFSKDSFSIQKYYGIGFIGGSEPYIFNATLNKLSFEKKVNDLKFTIANNRITFSNKFGLQNHTILYKKDADISTSNYDYERICMKTSTEQLLFAQLYDIYYTSQKTVYFQLYSDLNVGDHYYDYENNVYVPSGLTPNSDVYSFSMP